MNKTLLFLLGMAFCCLLSTIVRGADSTAHITLTAGAGGFTASSTLTTLNVVVKVTVAGSRSNTGLGALILFQGGGVFSTLQVQAVGGSFAFRPMTAQEKLSDSVVFQ